MTRNQLLSIVTGTILLTSAAWANAGAANSSDDQITDRVKSVLIQKDPDIARRVRIETQDGVVTLSGNVLTPQYEANLLRDTRQVDGVVKVHNDLTVD